MSKSGNYIILFITACIVLAIVYWYFITIQNKYKSLAVASGERFSDDATQVSIPILIDNDPKASTTSCNTENDIYTTETNQFNMRATDCTVYFTSNIHECDADKLANPDSTCKYTFKGWKELDIAQPIQTSEGTPNTYGMKVYNPQYTIEQNNHQQTTKCYKPLTDDDDTINYEYRMNATVVKDCDGGDENNMNTFNGVNYASFKFVNDSNPLTNYNNVINTICSLKYEPITSLNGIDLFRLKLDSNNNIISFDKVRLNDTQTGFKIMPFDLKTLFAQMLYKSAYEYGDNRGNLRIYSELNENMRINVELFKFRYNYLCPNSQIIEYSQYDVFLYLYNLIQFNRYPDLWLRDWWTTIKSKEWYKERNLQYENSRTPDKQALIIDKLGEEIEEKKKSLDIQMTNDSTYKTYSEELAQLNNSLDNKRLSRKRYYDSIGFNFINTDQGILSDYYLLSKKEYVLPSLDASTRIQNPEFYRAFGRNTWYYDFVYLNWKITSTLSGYSDEGLPSILTSPNNRNGAYGARGTNPIITITMDKPYYLTGFHFYGAPRTYYDWWRNPRNVIVDAQNEDNTWIEVKRFDFLSNAKNGSDEYHELNKKGLYKAIRFKVQNNNGHNSTRIVSIDLYHNEILTKLKKNPDKLKPDFHLINNDIVNNLTIYNKFKTESDNNDDSWVILMHTNNKKGAYDGTKQIWGYSGTYNWRSITASSIGASNRVKFGDGVGIYNGFFTAKNITYIALVDGSSTSLEPTTHNNHLVYKLVSSTGSESIYEIINKLDKYNRQNPNWAAADNVYNAPSVTNFTAGINGYSGLLEVSNGTWKTTAGVIPDKFCIWGINQDSDNDAQILCAYNGDLSTNSGKKDSWRGYNPRHTLWSYWSTDWHSDSQYQTISNSGDGSPGMAENAKGPSSIYLMGYMGDEYISKPYKEQKLEDNIQVSQNKIYIIKIITSIFLQKGYYKFTGFLQYTNMINMSIMSIELDNKYLPVSYFFTVDSDKPNDMSSQYKHWNTKDFIYISKSDFFNVSLVSYGHCKANADSMKPRFVYEYYSELNAQQTFISNYDTIDPAIIKLNGIRKILEMRSYSFNDLNNLFIKINGNNTNIVATMYNYYEKTKANDKKNISSIYKNIYTIYTDDGDFKNTYDDFKIMKGDMWGIKVLEAKINETNLKKEEVENHYKVLKGDLSNDSRKIKNNGIVSRKDALISQNERMITALQTLDYEKRLQGHFGSTNPPRLKMRTNINSCIQTAENTNIDTDMITTEKNKQKVIYLRIPT